MFVPIVLLFYLQIGVPASLRVWGGRDAEPNEYPYVVPIEMCLDLISTEAYYHRCTGSLLTPYWTLTAGHCGVDLPSICKKLVIRCVDDKKSTRYNVLDTITHKNMMLHNLIVNDIALMKNEEIKLQQYARLSAVDYSVFVGTEAVSVGYGLMNTSLGWMPPQILNKTLQIVDVMFAKCDASYIAPAVCTTPKCGGMSYLCPGDSGGPIIHKSGVVAVHSVGINCQFTPIHYYNLGPSKFVSVDVPISPYISWILEVMRVG